MSIQRWFTEEEACLILSATGDVVTYDDHVASHAYDEAKEIDLFAVAMVQSGRCAATKVVTDDWDGAEFFHFNAAWVVWKACAQSRARRFGA